MYVHVDIVWSVSSGNDLLVVLACLFKMPLSLCVCACVLPREGYNYLCYEFLIEGDSMMSLWTISQWNNMCRSVNVEELKFHHMKVEGDRWVGVSCLLMMHYACL
jgi:hypothetical protein